MPRPLQRISFPHRFKTIFLVLLSATAIALSVIARPAFHLILTAWNDRPPFASTVESFRLMLADGTIVQCSRQENAELFSLVFGGYGLFGIILDVNLKVVPNELYAAQRMTIPSREYIETYRQQVSADVGMAYGRLSIAPDSFLEEAILTTYPG